MRRRSARFHQTLLCLAFVAVSLFMLSSVLASTGLADPNIKIAMITAKTGRAGVTNSISFEAARFAVEEINDRGGILGRHVELLEYDNKSSAEGSAEAAHHAIQDGVHAVVGCNWSSHSLAMAKVLQEAKVPMITHMSTNESVTKVGDYIFRACFTDSFQGLGLARFARVSIKRKTAVVLVDINRPYSTGLADSFTKAYEKLGGKVIWRGEYRNDSIDYDGILKKVVELEPEVLFVPGGYDDVAGFFGRAEKVGLRSVLLSADGVGMQLYAYLKERVQSIYHSGHWSRWVDTPASKDFVKRYEAKVGPVQVDTLPLVYDSFMLFRSAIEKAGSVDGDKIRDALAATQGFDGVTGNISFDANGDPIKPLVINELKFGGSMYYDQIYP